MACASREGVARGQCAEGGVPAGAPTADQEPVTVDQPLRRQEQRGLGAVLHVHDAPGPVQALPVLTPVAAAAPVIDVHHGESTTGEELCLRVEEGAGVGGRAAMRDHDERRKRPVGSAHGWVRRGVEERVGFAAASCREPDGLGHGKHRRIDRHLGRAVHDLAGSAGSIEEDDRRRIARSAAQEGDGAVQRTNGGQLWIRLLQLLRLLAIRRQPVEPVTTLGSRGRHDRAVVIDGV